MGLISNGTTLLDAGALDSGVATGSMTLIKTLTASSSATLNFIDGTANVVLDSTYKEYEFHFIDIHPATDAAEFSVQFNAAGASGFNETIMSTFTQAIHSEDDSSEAGLGYISANDQNNGTAYQDIFLNAGNGSDECISGTLCLFNPSSTTFITSMYSEVTGYHNADASSKCNCDAIIDTTSAVDEVSFKFSAGAIESGTIKLYGIK